MWWNGRFSSWMCSNCVMLLCQYGPKSLKNVSNTLLNLCHEELRQFWRQKGVQHGTSKVYLIKWPVCVCVCVCVCVFIFYNIYIYTLFFVNINVHDQHGNNRDHESDLTIEVFIRGEFGHQTIFQKIRGKLLQLGFPVLNNLHTLWITHFHIY